MCNCAETRLSADCSQTSKYWDLFEEAVKACMGSQTEFEESQLIPVLQKLQDAYGYLPRDVIERLSEKTGIFVSKIMGVVTFYSQFRLEPVGKNIVRVCFGTACHVIGAENIADAICRELGIKLGGTTEDMMFTVESVACLGCCSLAPVIMINDETFGRLTPDTARSAIKDFKAKEGNKA